MKFVYSFLLIAALFFSCSNKTESGQKKKFTPTVLLTSAQLNKYGFERIENRNFTFLLLEDGFVLLNIMDNNLVRIKDDGKVFRYNAAGQGPGEFRRALNLFMYDASTIGVYDRTKRNVLLFDRELNYKSEIKIEPSISKLSPIKGNKGFIAYGLFKDNVFAILDKDFKFKKTFSKLITQTRLKLPSPFLLNMGYFLNGSQVVHTSWLYIEKECRIDIFNIENQQIDISLKWMQKRKRTLKDNLTQTNYYGSSFIEKYGSYYVIQNTFAKRVNAKLLYDLIIFDAHGNIIYRDENFPYGLITIENTPKSRLYLLTESDEIAYIDIKHLVKL